jgi:hypothetical protein
MADSITSGMAALKLPKDCIICLENTTEVKNYFGCSHSLCPGCVQTYLKNEFEIKKKRLEPKLD